MIKFLDILTKFTIFISYINRDFLRNNISEHAGIFSFKIESPVRSRGNASSLDFIRNVIDVKNCISRRQRLLDSRRDIAAERERERERERDLLESTRDTKPCREFPLDSRWTGNDLPMSRRINRRAPLLTARHDSPGVHFANDHSVILRLCSTLRPSRTIGTLQEASLISLP